LAAGRVKPIGLSPDAPQLHVFRLPLTDGGHVCVLFNTDESQPARHVTLTDYASPMTLTVARKRPALVWFDGRGALRAVETQGGCRVGNDSLLTDETRGIVLSLDGQDLRRSRALLLMPLQPGTIRLSQEQPWHAGVVATGEIRDGEWWSYESAPVTSARSEWAVQVSADQVFSLLLVCESPEVTRWTQAVERAMNDAGSLP
jgi:hypothetical protein